MESQPSRTEKVIKGLLTKPSQKPDFSAMPPPSILSQIKGFLPQFKESTEALISNPELARDHVMEIVADQPLRADQKVIEMSLGVGLFDVNPDAVGAMEKYIQQQDHSTAPHLVYFDEPENEDNMLQSANPLIQEVSHEPTAASSSSILTSKKKQKYTSKTAKKMRRAKVLGHPDK